MDFKFTKDGPVLKATKPEAKALVKAFNTLHPMLLCVSPWVEVATRASIGLVDVLKIIDPKGELAGEIIDPFESLTAEGEQPEKEEDDIAPCMSCGEAVHCVPEGLALCDKCAAKAAKEEAEA